VLCQALLPRNPKGLVAAYELLVVTSAISNLIRENKTYRITSDIQTGKKHGMRLMDDSLFNLYKQGLSDKEECIQKAIKALDLRARIEAHEMGRGEDEEEEPEEDEDEDDRGRKPKR
jgi:twitching motility protein PilT